MLNVVKAKIGSQISHNLLCTTMSAPTLVIVHTHKSNTEVTSSTTHDTQTTCVVCFIDEYMFLFWVPCKFGLEFLVVHE
jgi:hypothetical protein